MITVNLPGGAKAQFPDGTSPEVMKAAIQKKFPPQGGAPAGPAAAPAGLQPGTREYADWAAAQARAGKALPMVSPPPPESTAYKSPVDKVMAAYTSAVNSVPIAGPALMGGINQIKANIYGVPSEQIAQENRVREEANPISSGAGAVAGTVLPFFAGGEIPVVAKALGMSGGLGSQIAFGGMSGAAINAADTKVRGGSDQDAINAAGFGGAAGVGLPVIAKGIGKAIGAMTGKGTVAAAVPAIDDLQTAKNAAYQAVDSSGVKYSGQAYDNLVNDMIQRVANDNLSPTRHQAAFNMLADLQQRRGPLTLTQLDQLRQEIWRDVAGLTSPDAAGDAHFGKLMIEAIDDFVENAKPGDLIGGNATAAHNAIITARAANTTLKKSEALQNLIEETQRRVAATGSGGNIDNALRQAMNSLLKNKKIRWTAEERKAITNVVLGGGKLQDVLRLVGKLSPSGNGLMAALGLGSTIMNPAMAVAPAAGLVAKTISDGATKAAIGKLTHSVRTGGAPIPMPPRRLPALLPPGGAIPLLHPKREPLQITVGANRGSFR